MNIIINIKILLSLCIIVFLVLINYTKDMPHISKDQYVIELYDNPKDKLIMDIPSINGNGRQSLVVKNGKIIHMINGTPKWITNQVSCNGPVVERIIEISKENPETVIIIPYSDEDPFFENPYHLFHNNPILLHSKYKDITEKFGKTSNIIFFISCYYKSQPSFSNIYRMPWTDKIYEQTPTEINSKPILTKKKKIVWRGDKSGGQLDSLRIIIVDKLKNNEYCDVQFSSNMNKLTPEQQSEYRAILMIDGNSWPSSIVWNFLSGSVVIAVSVWHTYVFSKMKPWVDYIPCNPDLSDLNKNINLVMNDNKLDLQKIANNGKIQFLKYYNESYADTIIRNAIMSNTYKNLSVNQLET